ncbi:hypothetical protein [Paenibacillus sp. 1-18]|uniref:hypothetical protein n=1 Tax=Paenibacillus sp. 1-18 TaxID=1333846 RepID=UPI001E3E129C|nr:hypothetical protein [Paenibacillus sp. 1-18]
MKISCQTLRERAQLDNEAPLDFIQGMLGMKKHQPRSFAESAGENFIADFFSMF